MSSSLQYASPRFLPTHRQWQQRDRFAHGLHSFYPSNIRNLAHLRRLAAAQERHKMRALCQALCIQARQRGRGNHKIRAARINFTTRVHGCALLTWWRRAAGCQKVKQATAVHNAASVLCANGYQGCERSVPALRLALDPGMTIMRWPASLLLQPGLEPLSQAARQLLITHRRRARQRRTWAPSAPAGPGHRQSRRRGADRRAGTV